MLKMITLIKNRLKVCGFTLVLFITCTNGFAQTKQEKGKREVSGAVESETLDLARNEEYRNILNSYREKYAEGTISREALTKERDSAILNFVRRYPNSSVSLNAVYACILPIPITADFLEPLFNNLSSELKQSAKGKIVASIIGRIKNTSIGKVAPDFEENNTEEKPVKLSDYRGKYVLLDFWASWCHPCRDENPLLVKAFEQYKEKKFTIVSVSLDTDRDSWIKAIKEDNLTWAQLCDFGGVHNVAANLYAISSIPQNLLIDPNGEIIAKNLRGQKLTEVLEKILK
jgi:peroxiredoxin